MSDNIQLNAEPRADSGKGASRRLRRMDLVPAIVYGGDGDPQSISLSHNEFSHELENEAIYTQLIDLNIGKDTDEVILRDLQRHPYKKRILHADFFRIDKKKPIHVVVQIHALNTEDCVGEICRNTLKLMFSICIWVKLCICPKSRCPKASRSSH